MPSSTFRVKALYEYSSPHEDDLSFPPGVIITVTDEEDADWYGGEYHDDAGVKHEGIFPRNFVEKIEPQAPPRPTRTRTKREADPSPASAPAPAPEPALEPDVEHETGPEPARALDRQAEQEPEPQPDPAPVQSAKQKAPETQQSPPPLASPTSPRAPIVPIQAAAEPEPAPAPAAAPKQPEAAVATSPPAAKPATTQSKPAAPPPVNSKPSSNAFKDRIAAFNKPAAAPVAPFKPSGMGTGFIKKPFVAPPPSRNAYVPPPQQAPQAKVYRREEDPDIREQEAEAQENAEKAGFSSSAPVAEGEDEDQPKPTSLKERIALLQKQQAEQAQRHAESAGKKKEVKRPAKKRTDSHEPAEGAGEPPVTPGVVPHADPDTDEPERKTSVDSERLPPPPRRKSSKGPATEPHDGNEADMSGAGDTTEGPEELTEREEIDERPRRMSRVPTSGPPEPRKSLDRPEPQQEAEEADEEEEEDEEEDDEEAAEYRRKEELRARMMKMSGGMGMGHMFGAPPPPSAPPKKKKSSEPKPRASTEEHREEPTSPIGSAPPVPIPGMGMMALPGMGAPKHTEEPEEVDEPAVAKSPTSPRAPPPPPARPVDEDEDEEDEGETPIAPSRTSTDRSAPPPIPGGRPAPPPVPTEQRPVPPPPAADAPESAGSESDVDLPGDVLDSGKAKESQARSPPPLPPVSTRAPPVPPVGDDLPQSPTSPGSALNKRNSRLPPPIPGMAPALPPAVPGQSRPPPPPPPGGPLSRQSTQDMSAPPLPPSRPPIAGDDGDEEVTEYEGDYDTDIASSVPHKDALKSHARESSLEDSSSLKSPIADAPPSIPPPIPQASAPRAVPPPIPSQPPQSPPVDKRKSIDMPRAAPPAPPPRETPSYADEEYDPFNYSSPPPQIGGFSQRTPKIEEEPQFPGVQPLPSPPPQSRPPPPAPPGPGRASTRQSLDIPRSSTTIRRSMDMHRPSVESGFIANDIDLAAHNGWWRQPNQVPPVLQGRRDVHSESEESTTTQGSNTIVTRSIYILFQDYSQTILTVVFDPHDQSDVELDQRHEPPPRQLRQDELEQAYERFGRAISSAVTSKKDSVVGDGTPQGLVHELLRPFRDALAPVGTRAYGALVYANLANASTQQNDEIRPGDIVSIRNAKFQGKHGAMHAKYTAEVGKPDHVGIVAEWDGTKRKVRVWEQGRENKKVKMESFKLDDLRSGEVKVWRVMPRSWVGWNSQP